MSQVPKRRPPVRRVAPQIDQPEGDFEADWEEEPPPKRAKQPQATSEYSTGRRERPRGGGEYGGGGYRSRNVAPRRDPFPIILGALIGALMVGAVMVVYLLSTRSNQPVVGTSSNTSGSSANTVPTLANTNSQSSGPSSTGSTPPRMSLADFKALYDDPAKRPLIIDVRAQDAYEGGHIKGSFSAPESEIDALVVKIPKDKLVVAYCQ